MKRYSDYMLSVLAISLTLSFAAQAKEAAKTETKPVMTAANTAPAMSPEQEKMMKAMEEAGKITDQHKTLGELEGEWTTTSKMWQAPNAKPEESTGRTRFEPVLGGRFVREVMEGTAMGKPFQGLGYLGYDNTKKKYITTWMDSMSTQAMTMEGDSTDKGKTIKSSGQFYCPMTSKMETARTVLKKVGKKEMHFEMYSNDPAGKEFKSLDVVYKRM